MTKIFELIIVLVLSSFTIIEGGYYLFVGESAAGHGKYSSLYSILPDKINGLIDILLGILILILYAIYRIKENSKS